MCETARDLVACKRTHTHATARPSVRSSKRVLSVTSVCCWLSVPCVLGDGVAVGSARELQVIRYQLLQLDPPSISDENLEPLAGEISACCIGPFV